MKCFVNFVCILSVVVVVSAAPFLPSGGFGGTQLQRRRGRPHLRHRFRPMIGRLEKRLSNDFLYVLPHLSNRMAELPFHLRNFSSIFTAGNHSTPLFLLDAVDLGMSVLQLGSGGSGGNGAGLGGLTNILSQVDLPGLLQGINSFVKLIGVFCPPCSQILDNIIQNVTSTAFRVFGRAILQGGGLGGGAAGGGGGSGGGVSVVLPTFPPDEEDDYDDESDSSPETPVVQDRFNAADAEATKTTTTVTESTIASTTSKDENNLVAKRHARFSRDVSVDQEPAESAPEPVEDLSDLDDDQDRNKRFLPFGGGSSSGGSGNFLFDIIRNTADRAARMVGTVYRMVAGTQHFGWNANVNNDKPENSDYIAAQSSPAVQLIAGSGATEESDEKANSPDGAEGDVHQKSADHHYSEGIPGPITRLLVIANRGVANLLQDLILRLAQTSERLVNFKARLITSLI